MKTKLLLMLPFFTTLPAFPTHFEEPPLVIAHGELICNETKKRLNVTPLTALRLKKENCVFFIDTLRVDDNVIKGYVHFTLANDVVAEDVGVFLGGEDYSIVGKKLKGESFYLDVYRAGVKIETLTIDIKTRKDVMELLINHENNLQKAADDFEEGIARAGRRQSLRIQAGEAHYKKVKEHWELS